MRALLLAIVVLPLAAASYPFASSLLPDRPLTELLLVDVEGRPFTFRYPTSIVAHGDTLLVVEGGRAHYVDPYDGVPRGALWRVHPVGRVGVVERIAADLADPIGIAVASDGSYFVTVYGGVARITGGAVATYATGYPTFKWDATYLPGGDEDVMGQALAALGLGGLRDGVTTGTMSLAFAEDGTLVGTQAAHGRPPDDPLLGGRSYEEPVSSSVLRIEPGALAAGGVTVARGCRNCFDLAFAPAESPFAGRLFATENTDVYRLRAQSGERRTALEGSSLTDAGVLDALVEVLPADGRVRRVATFQPDGPTLGAVPAGLAFAPRGFAPGLDGLPIVVLMGADVTGFAATPFRGWIAAVLPDDVAGIGSTIPLVQGLREPVDVAFGGDGRLYVLEYDQGRVYFIPPAGG